MDGRELVKLARATHGSPTLVFHESPNAFSQLPKSQYVSEKYPSFDQLSKGIVKPFLSAKSKLGKLVAIPRSFKDVEKIILCVL